MKELALTIQKQKQDNWCWAAVAASTDAFYRGAAAQTQCQIASGELGGNPNCCTKPDDCDRTSFLERALDKVGHLRGWSGPESYDKASEEIEAECPLGVRIQWNQGGGGHFVLVTGYDENRQVVTVKDPSNASTSIVAFQELQTSYLGLGFWTHSYFTKP